MNQVISPYSYLPKQNQTVIQRSPPSLLSSFLIGIICSRLCGHRIMVIISVFQTDDRGSIPLARSKKNAPPSGGVFVWADRKTPHMGCFIF